MPGMFIDVEVDPKAASDPQIAAKGLRVVDENLDECVLCDLCIDAAPKGAVKVVKLYDR
jgi:NAD-dependent dihydropyrimidine dehydrogenase PreA subunit